MKTSIRFLAVIFAVAMMVLAFTTVSANSFSDVKNDNPHAKAIDSLTNLGIIHGYEDDTFKPDLPVRRDEMAKLVYTTFTTSTDAGDGVVTFPDVAKDSWAKGYISWCAAMKIVGGYEDGTFKPEGNVTYDEALKMVCAMLGYVDFKVDMWPIDVRLKALIDLNLGEGLEDVAGDAPLTRGQVAQLFKNSLDEQMYVAPLTEEDKKLGTFVAVTTLAQDVWGYTEAVAEVVATENYGLVVPYAIDPQVAEDEYFSQGKELPATILPEKVINRSYTKTGKEDSITLRFLDEDGNAIMENGVEKLETVKLEDLGLDSYVGKTDELLVRNIDVLINKKGEYTSATLKGKMVENFSGAAASTANAPEDEKIYALPKKKLGLVYHKYGVKIDGKDHTYDNFQAIRKLVYLDSTTCSELGYAEGSVLAQPATAVDGSCQNYYLDSKGNVINVYSHDAWSTPGNPRTEFKNLSFPRAVAVLGLNYNVSNRTAIDADGDGYFEYVSFNYQTAYIVEAVSKKEITLKYAYNNKTTIQFTYSKDNFHSEAMPEKGDVIVGYLIADDFYHVGTASMITAFSTKYATSTTLYGYGTYSGNSTYDLGNGTSANGAAVLSTLASSSEMSPYVGVNSKTGDYNYANYHIYAGSILYATVATAEDVQALTDAQSNKAILMFVDKPTEPQINEKTKQYEIFYPAYLIINGKEELVNLNPASAVNGNEAATIAQDGSMYRAYVDKDGYVMYPNILVTYEVDDDGYYSLKTSAGVDSETTDEKGNVVEKLIAAQGYYLTIDSSTKIMSIVDGSDNVIVNKIVADNNTVIYYPYTKKTTGTHEYINFYFGSDIPSDFEKIELIGDTYLTKDNDSGFFFISTAMVAKEGFEGVGSATVSKVNYKTDARYHLIALADTDAVYDEAEEDVLANYYFQGIYEGTAVTGTNKDKDYSSAKKALTAGIYAWDEEEEDYVEVDDTLTSFGVQNIEEVLADMSIIFTAETPDGLKLNETTKIIAIKDVPDNSDEEFLFEEIALEDLDTLLVTIDEYNEINSASEKLEAKIGTYVDDDKKTQIAYIIVNWVEYDEELEAYTFAGETK